MKGKVIIIMLAISALLLLGLGPHILEIIPDTRKIVYNFESPNIVVSEGETIAIKYTAEPGVTSISRAVFFKLSRNPGSYLVGTSRTLTCNDEEWVNKVLVESNGKDWVNGKCAIGGIDGPIYLLLKVMSGGDAEFAYGGILATSDSYKFTTSGTANSVDNLAFSVLGSTAGVNAWYQYFPLRSWLNYKFGFAIEFKIPDSPTFNALEGGILRQMPSGYRPPTAGGWAGCIFGFSRTMTMDETQWCRMGWLQRNHGPTMHFGGCSVICQPGETWYLMGKMKTEGLRYVGYGASTDDYPGVKCYHWDDYDNVNDYREMDTIIGFEIYGQTDEPFYADFEWSPVYPEPGEQIQFTDKSHPELVDSWEWAFELGQYSYEQNPTYTFNEIGDYTVTLTAISVHGTPIEVNKEITVDDRELPEEEFEWWWLGLIGLIGVIGLIAFRRF